MVEIISVNDALALALILIFVSAIIIFFAHALWSKVTRSDRPPPVPSLRERKGKV